MLYPYPGYLWHGRTELTEVPGTRMNVCTELTEGPGTGAEVTEVPGIVARAYRPHTSFGQVSKCCTHTPGICGMIIQSLQTFRVHV